MEEKRECLCVQRESVHKVQYNTIIYLFHIILCIVHELNIQFNMFSIQIIDIHPQYNATKS